MTRARTTEEQIAICECEHPDACRQYGCAYEGLEPMLPRGASVGWVGIAVVVGAIVVIIYSGAVILDLIR